MNNATFSTAELSDSHPDAQVCTSSLVQYGKTRRFCGPIRAAGFEGDLVVLGELLRQKSSGEILVVDANGRVDFALLGDRLASVAVENGWMGVIINGAVRDVSILAGLSLGIKALGTCPRRAPLSGRVSMRSSVFFGTVTFRSGGWLYSDDDGVITTEHPLMLPTMRLTGPG